MKPTKPMTAKELLAKLEDSFSCLTEKEFGLSDFRRGQKSVLDWIRREVRRNE